MLNLITKNSLKERFCYSRLLTGWLDKLYNAAVTIGGISLMFIRGLAVITVCVSVAFLFGCTSGIVAPNTGDRQIEPVLLAQDKPNTFSPDDFIGHWSGTLINTTCWFEITRLIKINKKRFQAVGSCFPNINLILRKRELHGGIFSQGEGAGLTFTMIDRNTLEMTIKSVIRLPILTSIGITQDGNNLRIIVRSYIFNRIIENLKCC